MELAEAIKLEGWTRRKEMVKGGEYSVSDVERTVTVSADGRFKIYPDGCMTTSKTNGAHGDRYSRWSWTGYACKDYVWLEAYNAGELHNCKHPNFFGCRTVARFKEAVAKFRITGR